ncbi:MAG TPA: MarR family transcriptional regulator [Xanthobacteraceae bacterium]|nr:MarR family transcriptional regulator [Xanthobacteraceae bacterium]
MTRKGRRLAADAGDTSAEVDFGQLSQSLGYALRRAQLAVFKNFRDTFASLDVTPAQYSVLLVIGRNPGLKQTQVSDALNIKRANFVALIDALERRGLAERTAATDRRSYALYLTASGRKLLKTLDALNAVHEDKVAASIGQERRAQLLALLSALTAPLDGGEIDDESEMGTAG